MNSIGKHLPLIGILLLTIFVGAAAGLYFDVPGRLQSATRKSVASQQYTYPMHPDVVSAKPGSCPKCGMALVLASQAKAGHDQCGDNGENHPGCCADKSVTESATELRLPPGHPPIQGDKLDGPRAGPRQMELPPGHPPIPGWPTNAHSESKSASSDTPAHSSH
jgi:hypothetical protein